jgi:phage/plasmid-like protein (TIGR03299 family)
MAHEIQHYVGRKSAWHNLGTVYGDYLSIDDLLNDSALNYTVSKRQLEYDRKPIDAWGTFRDDTNEFLSTVGKDYVVMQHVDGFKIADSFIGNGVTKFETAGVLGIGERVWCLARLDTDILIGGEDKIENYLLFSTSHDGSLAFEFRLTNIRVVCANTLRAAKAQGLSNFKVYHTKNAQASFEQALQAMKATREELKTVEEQLNFLNSRAVRENDMKEIFDALFGKKDSKRGQTRLENVLNDILELYESNDNDSFPHQRGTAYNLLNAIVEYTDHVKGGFSNLSYATIGAGAKLKEAAYEIILDAAGNMMPSSNRVYYSIPAAEPSNDDVNKNAVKELLGL